MTLAEFKARYGLSTINFYKSSISNRLVSSLPNGEMIVTKENFDSKSDIYVYTVEPGEDNSLENTIHVFSNKAPKTPDLVL